MTSYALGSAVAAPLAGRVVTRIGRPLVVGACFAFGVGSLLLGLVARQSPGAGAALAFALPLFVVGVGSGAVITPNQTLALADVDPVTGSTAGGVLQTAQRIGSAVGQAVIGATFFAALPEAAQSLGAADRRSAYGHALGQAVVLTLCFIGAAVLLGLVDLLVTRRRSSSLRRPSL